MVAVTAMRRLIAEILDPATRYECELPLPTDIARVITGLRPRTGAISAQSALARVSIVRWSCFHDPGGFAQEFQVTDLIGCGDRI